MFNEHGYNLIRSLVTMEKMLNVLKYFSKDKCPSMDGWVVEIFIQSKEIMGLYLLRMVEKSRINRRFFGAINTNFITLIPIVSSPKTFRKL